MKIAVVFDNMIYGGIERVGINHIKLLKELGHEVETYILDPKTEEIVEELKKISKVNFISLSKYYCPESYWVLTRRFKWGKYIFPFTYLLISLVHYVLKIFKYQSKQYDIAIAFSGHYNDLSFVANNFLKSKKKIAWLHGALYQYVLTAQGFENLYKKIKNLVVLVDDAQEEVISYHQKDNFKFNIKKIYNPITISKQKIDFKKIKELQNKYGEYFIMISRLSYPHKDHYTVIRAIRILKEEYGIKKNLLLVGDGPEKEKLKKFIYKEKMEENIIFIGSQEDVQNYYLGAKMLLHASIAGEGLPTVLLEAMDLGIPVVCTDSKVGPREILGDNEYGLLTKVKNPFDMAEKIYKLLSDKNLYEHYQIMGKERMKDFSNIIIKNKLEEFFTTLI